MTDLKAVAPFDIPFEKLEDSIYEWVREALELRHGAANDPEGPLHAVAFDQGSGVVLDELLRVRVRSDRVAGLLAKAVQAKGRARRAEEQAKFVAEQAYDEATRVHAGNRVEFSTGKERHADAALDSLEERRVAHHAARLVSVTQEAYDIISQVHWQLDSIRKDLRDTLRAQQFESSLER